jgi:hypothetical protein
MDEQRRVVAHAGADATGQRCWPAWSHAPPPPPLQALLDAVSRGHPLCLYLRL